MNTTTESKGYTVTTHDDCGGVVTLNRTTPFCARCRAHGATMKTTTLSTNQLRSVEG